MYTDSHLVGIAVLMLASFLSSLELARKLRMRPVLASAAALVYSMLVLPASFYVNPLLGVFAVLLVGIPAIIFASEK